MKTNAHFQPTFLQELRDLLAIVVMLVALKIMLFGDVPLGSILQHILPDRAVASTPIPVNIPITPATEAEDRTLNKDAYESMSHRLDYLDDLLETINSAPKPATAAGNQPSR